MALKRNPDTENDVIPENSISGQKAKQLFSQDPVRTSKKENKVLTTFSIEPSFKRELEELFASMGLGWAAGIRFSLKEFSKKHTQE